MDPSQWSTRSSLTTKGHVSAFWDAIDIWLNKPHVTNRRLCGSDIVFKRHNQLLGRSLEQAGIQIRCAGFTKNDHWDKLLQAVNCSENFNAEGGSTSVIIRDLLPKQLDKIPRVREVILQDKSNHCIFFIPVYQMDKSKKFVSECKKDAAYAFRFHPDKMEIELLVYDPAATESESESAVESSDADHENLRNVSLHTHDWLANVLLTKLARWSAEDKLNTEITSLRLIPADKYNQEYQRLKAKYGPYLVSIWPECTDPQKFVYEDIAIAAYLLVFWEQDEVASLRPQSFVDLGCGNGLLVHILSKEGHIGLGLDIRKRKIWDMYDPKPNLKEQTITPSDDTLFPDYDWLIGNHSDELTPWIPVMAARSSYSCRYFVLPCCPWDFTQKFAGHSSKVKGGQQHGQSQYGAYLKFVEEVGMKCGFDVVEDTLRIPSTKRVCFIGKARHYSPDEEGVFDCQRKEYIKYRISLYPKNEYKDSSSSNNSPESKKVKLDSETVESGQDSWAEDFKARSSEEKPKNCVSVDASIKDEIVQTVFNKLLEEKQFGGSDPESQVWNPGGSLTLSKVAQLFHKEILLQLKSECGGLQTLLRNHHHIFKVQAGNVILRDWRSDDYIHYQAMKHKRKGQGNRNSEQLKKTKLCYFYAHHPQGCPLSPEECRFAHGDEELQVKPVTKHGIT